MKKTLQDQYLLIKEGKGHKGVFLTEAKREFPHIVRNAATFDEAVASLKTKNIISENVLTVMPAVIDRPKKETYETAFEAFLAEAKKKKDEDEKVKAEEKKVSKPVEEDLSHNFDRKDEKNPDNMIFDQIMTGYYAEMKDPKNADKTMQELKDIVFKNLAKDPIYYTKDGQFGVKDLGYVTEAPGLGEPKEPKGKYKSSGYGDLNEGIMYGDSDGDRDHDYEMKNKAYDLYDKGLEAYSEGDLLKADRYYREALRAGSWLNWDERDLPPYDSLNEGMFSLKPLGDVEEAKKFALKAFRAWIGKNAGIPDPELMSDYQVIDKIKAFAQRNPSNMVHQLWNQSKHLFEADESVKKFTSDFKDQVTNKKNSPFTPEQIKAKIAQKRKEELEDRKLRGESLEELAIREVIQNMIFEELNRAEPIPTSLPWDDKRKEEFKNVLIKLEQPHLNDKAALSDIQKIYSSHIQGLNSISQNLKEDEVDEVMYQAPSVNTSNTGGGGRRYIPNEAFLSQELIDKFNFSNPGPNTPSRDESLQIPHIKFLTKPEGSIMLISNFLYNAIQGLERGRTSREKEMGKNELEKLISDLDPMVRALIKKNVDPKMSFSNYHAVNMPIDRKKGVGVTIPLSKEEKEELEEMIIRESLLKEGVEKEIAEINKMAEYEILESKLQKLTDAIEKRRSQLVKLDEDEDMKALTDKKKIKELEKDIKTLEKAKAKLEKIASKHKGKVKKTEVIDETEEDFSEAEGYIKDAGQNLQDIVDEDNY